MNSVRAGRANSFKDQYRQHDVLIMDDVQFIANTEKTQEELFHLFNTLHDNNRQIVFSSDKHPALLPGLEERLKGRFSAGMVAEIPETDVESRVAIIKAKLDSHGFSIPEEIIQFIAENVRGNIRELEGALNQLLAFCEMRNLTPDIHIATSLLGSSKQRPKHISARQIIERTAKHFHVSMEDILGPKRDKDIVVPRQIAMYMLRCELHLSFPKIAHELGRKDHTTAIHSVEKIEKELGYDGSIKQNVGELKERLYA